MAEIQTIYQAMIEALMKPGSNAIPYIEGTRNWLEESSRVPQDKSRLSRTDRYSMGIR